MCPCKDCKIRELNCHSTCKDYLEYDKRNKEKREQHIIDLKARILVTRRRK